MDFSDKILALIGKNGIFAYSTLKLTFWPWKWPWIIKIMQEIDCPVKITWKWGITLVPGFICWKIIFDLEISSGHFVFVLKKFRPRVPKWHPADSCSGHPIVSESIIKRRPYRETRFSQNLLDYKFRHTKLCSITMHVLSPILRNWTALKAWPWVRTRW